MLTDMKRTCLSIIGKVMMRTRWNDIIGGLLGMGLLLMQGGCAEDHDEAEQQPQRELHLSLGSQRYNLTRASGDLPTSFVAYNHATALAPITQIQTYLTYHEVKENEAVENGYVSSIFNYQQTAEEAHTWVSRVALKDGQYYLYGFLPKIGSEGNITIAPYNDNYANGAILTFTGLNAVMTDDICVIVGAKAYSTEVPDMTNGLGKFDYHTDNGNNLFLLVDHLLAGIQFNMRMGEKYSQRRVIKVKSLKLTPKDGENAVVATFNATVTIVANENQTDPISNVVFTTTTGTNPQAATLYEGEKELTVNYQSFLACSCPTENKKYVLDTTYDVYDMKQNLIREGQTARNVITLTQNPQRGKLQTVNITVEPTYLYVLSDADLDNPTFKVE